MCSPINKSRPCETNGDRTSRPGSFNLLPRTQFDYNPPYLRQPKEIGCFSLDLDRKISCDKSQLRYYIEPETPDDVCMNLREGYKDLIQKDESKKDLLDDILRWISCHRSLFSLSIPSSKSSDSDKQHCRTSQEKLNTDFISWRGCLTRLMCTPYENRDGWLLAVTRFNDTFFLCEFNTEEKIELEANCTDRQREMCYWGVKFEQYLTSATKESKPDTTGIVNNCEAFCSVVRTRLKSHSLVFAGEVDCICPQQKEYIELKTSREIYNKSQDDNFKRFKLIKWWGQSFLIGVPTIVCGFRDDDGIVHRLQKYHINMLPNLAKDLPNSWYPKVCINFLDQFLNFIKETVKDNDHRSVHLFSREPKKYNNIRYQYLGKDSEYNFIPDWFVEDSGNKGNQTENLLLKRK
ncbi:decapping and exoribonuclease protein [Octopus sinensis]|uniref:Decapping nuclease n=1 Tax=Octopus sinensis TaxID=2607531 RepID=A0A6P7TXU5_9MOLL|nr:decapping and exoribonuclease protein [Octopus sinensis]